MILQASDKESKAANAQKTQTPLMGFRKAFLKASVVGDSLKASDQIMAQFWLMRKQDTVKGSKIINPLASVGPGATFSWSHVNVFHFGEGLSICKTTQKCAPSAIM